MGCYLGDRSQAGSLPFGLELLPGGGGGVPEVERVM